jgi:hypothetical protein
MVEVPVAVVENRPSREVLWVKAQRKIEDLLSARLDRISFVVGIPLLLTGFSALVALTIEKLRYGAIGGFVNPYAFLLSMLLVISGFQIVSLGLLTKLIMQIRRQVAKAIGDKG